MGIDKRWFGEVNISMEASMPSKETYSWDQIKRALNDCLMKLLYFNFKEFALEKMKNSRNSKYSFWSSS